MSVPAVVGRRRTAFSPKADPPAQCRLIGEYPMETEQRAWVLNRVIFERTGEAGSDGALCRAVRTMQQHDAIWPSLTHEIAERAIDLRLHGFLPNERVVARVGIRQK